MLVIRWAGLMKFKDRILQRKRKMNRAYQRISSFNLLKYYDPSARSPELLTNIVDLSEGGLQFTARQKLATGSMIQMVINLIERNQDIPILGRVVWIRPLDIRYKVYRVGVLFEEIRPEHRGLLRSLVLDGKLT